MKIQVYWCLSVICKNTVMGCSALKTKIFKITEKKALNLEFRFEESKILHKLIITDWFLIEKPVGNFHDTVQNEFKSRSNFSYLQSFNIFADFSSRFCWFFSFNSYKIVILLNYSIKISSINSQAFPPAPGCPAGQ